MAKHNVVKTEFQTGKQAAPKSGAIQKTNAEQFVEKFLNSTKKSLIEDYREALDVEGKKAHKPQVILTFALTLVMNEQLMGAFSGLSYDVQAKLLNDYLHDADLQVQAELQLFKMKNKSY